MSSASVLDDQLILLVLLVLALPFVAAFLTMVTIHCKELTLATAVFVICLGPHLLFG
jgi:hypothetical protein